MDTRTSTWRRAVRHLLVLGAVVSVLALSSAPVALAQNTPPADQGPRFNNWGPGQPPPEPEGPAGEAAPQAPSTTPGAPPSGRAAPAPGYGPEYAPAPAPGYAPNPDRWGGCRYDLRGSWTVEGRQTDPWSYRYATNIYVRQYRGWLQIEQPEDGVSYYGVCRGDSIQLDVYMNGRFVGYQDGEIGGGGGRWWGGGLNVRSEWTTFTPYWATGRETWRRWG